MSLAIKLSCIYGLALGVLIHTLEVTQAPMQFFLKEETLGHSQIWAYWLRTSCYAVGVFNLLLWLNFSKWNSAAIKDGLRFNAFIYGVWSIQNFMLSIDVRAHNTMLLHASGCALCALLSLFQSFSTSDSDSKNK